jgi:hypothetical protein
VQSSATTLQAVLSSRADALATGRLSLASSGLFSLADLFDTSAVSDAACYGPATLYANHDDANGSSGTLPLGSVAMWADTDASGTPCAVAQLNARTAGLSARTNQAVLVMGGLRFLLAAANYQMPAAGQSNDITPHAGALLTTLLGGVSIQAASVALNSDGTEYTYRLVLARGTGASAQSVELALLHTPAETQTRYAGVLRITQSYLSSDASIGCTDLTDGSGHYKVARLTSIGYNRQDQWLSLRARTGQYCGNPSANSSNHAAELATLTTSGELDASAFLIGTRRAGLLGWRQGFARMTSDVVMSSQTSDFVYAWQDKPSGTAHARMFAGHLSLDTATSSRALNLYHGDTDDISNTDGTLIGLMCNNGGPGSTRTVQTLFQQQSLSLPSTGTSWTLSSSKLRYAPTNSCNAGSMAFDANGDGRIVGAEGSGLVNDLAAPTQGRLDVQDELIEQGFLPPVLVL